MSGRSVSSMDDRKSITDNRRRINLNQTFFCPTYVEEDQSYGNENRRTDSYSEINIYGIDGINR